MTDELKAWSEEQAYTRAKAEYMKKLDKIRAEITEYKDDKVIHAEQNEMIDIVFEIIDKYR